MTRVSLKQGRFEPGRRVHGTIHEPGYGLFTLELRWETSGKGDTDRTVVHREVLSANNADLPFAAQLPLLPLTYSGTLIKIAWFARVSGGPDGGAFDLSVPFEVGWSP